MSLEYLLDRTLFSPGQWAEIRRGDDEGVDILAYADTKFTQGQMHEIYLGLKDGVDVSIYADPVYSEAQMFCLRRGLHQDQNILPYYSPAKSPEEMKSLYDDQRRENAPPSVGRAVPHEPWDRAAHAGGKGAGLSLACRRHHGAAPVRLEGAGGPPRPVRRQKE